MNAFCLMGDSGTTLKKAYITKSLVFLLENNRKIRNYRVWCNIIAGVESENIVNAVKTITSIPWGARYDLNNDGFIPSNVVINALVSNIKNYF